jgi:hypothetical protein
MLIPINSYKDCIHDNNTIFFTITNYGYIIYTLNMLKSLKPWGLDKKVLVICIDNKSNQFLKTLGYSTWYFPTEYGKFTSYNKPGYDRICYYKLLAICKILEAGYNVFYFDGDIVFQKNPVNFLKSWLSMVPEVLIQNDTQDDLNKNNMCMGCIFVKSTENTRKYFICDTESTIKSYNMYAGDNNDQSFFNKLIKPYVNVDTLLLEEFPNGKYFTDNAHNIKHKACLIHFNWLIGHEKLIKMKEYSMWYVTEDEEDII